MDIKKVRIWETHFETIGKMNNMPYPGEVVREVERKGYSIDCKGRKGFLGSQLQYTLSGEGVFQKNDEVIRMKPGMAFLQNHNDNSNMYYYPEDGVEPWHFIWISFLSPTVEKMVDDITTKYGQVFHIPIESHLVKTLFSYQNPKRRIRFISAFEGAHLVMDILTELGKYTSPGIDTVKTPDRMVLRAQEYIHNNLDKVISIEDVATECGVSREHFSRIFKEQLDESPSAYLIRSRIEQAIRLLISTNLSCKEIASMVGYDNAVSFNRTFKRLVKMTPLELRIAGYSPQIR